MAKNSSLAALTLQRRIGVARPEDWLNNLVTEIEKSHNALLDTTKGIIGNVTTLTSGTFTIAVIPISALTSTSIHAYVTMRKPSTDQGAAFDLFGGCTRGGGGLAWMTGSPGVTVLGRDVATWNAQLALDVPNSRILVQGITTTVESLSWNAQAEIRVTQ